VVDLQCVWDYEAELVRACLPRGTKINETRPRRIAMDFAGSLLTTAGTVTFERGVWTGIFLASWLSVAFYSFLWVMITARRFWFGRMGMFTETYLCDRYCK
jgi:hypothetical protein